MKKTLLPVATFLTALIFGHTPTFADNTMNTGYFGGVAIMGYDPVAYFTEGRATKGSEEFSYDWLGTPWYFASRQHRELFKSEPVKYAPQFGGYCAGEIAGDGITVNIDPEAWRIIDGKLYLVYDKGYAELFEAQAKDILPKAEANWPKLAIKLNQEKYY
jgi:YHS domain-containing protein